MKIKTKRVDRIDLSSNRFAYAGSDEDTNSWKFPICFPGDIDKTINHIKHALHRFDSVRGIPDHERPYVWFTLYGAAKALGITVDRREFPRNAAEPPSAEVKAIEIDEAQGMTERELAVLLAEADQRADAFLKQLGLE